MAFLRRSLNALAAAAVVGLALHARPAWGLDDLGHLGVFGQALQSLRAMDSRVSAAPWQNRWLNAAVYPDAAVTYPKIPETFDAEISLDIRVLGQTIRIPLRDIAPRLWVLLEVGLEARDFLATLAYSLNSSEHNFDQSKTTRSASDFATQEDIENMFQRISGCLAEGFIRATPLLRNLPAGAIRDEVKKLIAGAIYNNLSGHKDLLLAKRRTYAEYVAGREGSVDLSGTDGKGYNAVSAILFFLNGGADASSNPSGASPSEGFIALARKGDVDGAAVALGSAAHYIGDLFAPGHTDWELLDLAIAPREDLPLSRLRLHEQFDKESGQYFLDRNPSQAVALRPILAFRQDAANQPCDVQGKPNLGDLGSGPFWEKDLPRELKAAATESQRLWKTGTPRSQGYHNHLEQAVVLTAGVVDWAFSRAVAEAKNDGPYARDATNFLGMAAALATAQDASGALLTPETLQGKECYLGGIDRDDYFPISGSQVSRVSVAVKEGPKEAVQVEVFDPTGAPLPANVKPGADAIDLYLGKAVDKFLLRVYSPDGTAVTYTISFSSPPSDKGMLDLVLCIDKSGSMVDDIKAVQGECDATLDALDQYAKTNNIDLRVGLVTYTRHDEPDWIQGNPLTADVATIRRYIQAISITNLALGKGGNEDMYGALMYAMNEPVGGQKMAMGWRPGAAKIVFPIGDEPPDDPDWENRTLDDVALVAKNLDPVHMYPLLTPKQGSTFLDPAARAMERIAKATGGQVFRVASAEELPETVVAAVKLAVRQHRNEVWRKQNPPYVLYGAIAAVLAVMALTTVGLILRAALSGPNPPTPPAPTPRA